MDILPLLKEFGFPVALCVVLLLAIRQQNGQLVKAFTDRIKTLESVVRDQGVKIADLESDRIRRADEYAQTLKDVAARYATVVREHNAWNQRMMDVLSRLVDSIQIRPCMMERYEQHESRVHQKVPSSSEIPAPPRHDPPGESPPSRHHA